MKKRRVEKALKAAILAVCVFAFSACAFAEDFAIQPLDDEMNPIENETVLEPVYNYEDFQLQDALAIALKQNKNIISAREGIEIANGKVLQARSAAGPQISGKYSFTRLDEDTPGARREPKSLGISLSQPIYLGLKDRAGLKSARIGREISKHSHTLVKQQIVKAVSLSYYGWIYAKEVEEVGKKNVELAQAHYDLVNKRYAAEQASKYELLRADVRLAQTKSEYVANKNSTQLARLTLLNQLSLPSDIPLNTSYKLHMEDILPQIDVDLEVAVKAREDLKISRYQIELAKQGLVKAKGDKRPTIRLVGEAGQNDPKAATGKKDGYWQAGVSLSMPIVDAGLSKGEIKEANAGIKQAQINYENSLEATNHEIYASAISLNSAKQVVIAQEENLKQAEETLRLAKVRYENGLFTQVDLFDAETAWSNARLLHINAIYKHHSARLDYLLAVGSLGRDLNSF